MPRTARWRVTASLRNPDWLVVIGPFDSEFVADLKRAVPPAAREWSAVLRAWKIHKSHREQLDQCIEAYS